ncbi:MAG TPA: xanthine dehydrogenase family protein subunit M [Aestuariivirgaceae bacterium]|jgi:aerobic carbon-monoxide dehydrogenase medium subunit|nr:xanthine dehydrogenase family protein subunit M [Aestuariivirgaceae bacterium]
MRYEAPVSLEAASALLAEAPAQSFVLAGGTDLLVRMKGGFVEPELIVDIKHIPDLQELRLDKDGFVIGAAVPCAALGENVELSAQWPGVVEAANLIGSKQIQGRCTIVGNLCNASPAADSVPALVTAAAKVRIRGRKGTRTVAIETIPVGPGKTSLAKGEFIEAVLLEKRRPRSADAYLRFIPRSEMDIAVVSAGVDLERDKAGVITKARVALGAVAPTVMLVEAAAAAIIGSKLEDKALTALAEACSAACQPINDKRGTVEFRTKVAGVLARRAAQIAYQRAGER